MAIYTKNFSATQRKVEKVGGKKIINKWQGSQNLLQIHQMECLHFDLKVSEFP